MKNNLIRTVILILIMFMSAAGLYAVEEPPVLKLGICKINYKGSGPDSISGGISNRLFEVLSILSERRITSEEITEILSTNKQDDLRKKIIELETTISAKDKLVFSGGSPDDIIGDIAEKDELIAALRKEISSLEVELGEEKLQVSEDDFSRIDLVSAVPDDGKFFLMSKGTAADTASDEDLDLIVYGSIEEVDDYYYIEFKVWNNIIGRDIAVWKSAVRYDELEKEIIPGIEELKTAILGREWAALKVESSPNSMIYIDGNFAGIGRIGDKQLEPGPHYITVRQAGFESVEQELELGAREIKIISLDTEIRVERKVIFQTYPQGADLYLDSVWVGKTPVNAEIQTFPTAVRLSMDGWEDKEFFVERDSEPLIDINLKPDTADRSSWVDNNRSRFYASMGAFIMSIPLTAFCYGGLEQTALAYNTEYDTNGLTNLDELNRLQSLNKAVYAAYLASLGLNIILFFDTIFQAVDYVGSVDYVSN